MRSRFTQRITSHTGIRQYSSHWINRIQNIRNSYYIQYILFSTYLANSDYHNAHSVKCSVMQHHITFLCLSLKNVSVFLQAGLQHQIHHHVSKLKARQNLYGRDSSANSCQQSDFGKTLFTNMHQSEQPQRNGRAEVIERRFFPLSTMFSHKPKPVCVLISKLILKCAFKCICSGYGLIVNNCM